MPFDEPQSRNEAILQNMLGASNVLLPPESRIEILLQMLLNQGGEITPASLLAAAAQLSTVQQAQMREDIGAISLDDIGTVFTLKGSVATVSNLPATENSLGDVYYVESVSAGYIWLTSETQPNGYWEELGETIDLSAYELKPTINTIATAITTITPLANSIYQCGTLTSLTITNPPATGAWSVVFTSGSTATDCDFPDSLQWQNDTVPTINANKTYEIIVKDNRGVCGEFPVAGVSAS